MRRQWTFGQKVGAGFALLVAGTVAMAVVAAIALNNVVQAKDAVITQDARLLIDVQRVNTAVEAKRAAARGYLFSRETRLLQEMREAQDEFDAAIARLASEVRTEEGRRAVAAVERAGTEYQTALERVIALRDTPAPLTAVVQAFNDEVTPRRAALSSLVDGLVERQERGLEAAQQAATATAAGATRLVLGLAALIAVIAAAAGVILARLLARQIGQAVGQVQSSSAELQASASQQATGARQQASAMSEIATTITELLTTSRQIAESAQRVAQIAGETARGAATGEGTVTLGNESIATIRRQVELIVEHMLDLGRKAQRVGVVLDIVAELAEQTNILAINATIEAAGAGEAGQRFGVVAEEIRKLADRVGASTKEIRGLVEDVRSAANSTVMATEGGAKAVEAGARQFDAVAAAFREIAGQVGTTTEAAREIELSTKQQATAVEQVNTAVASVAQATKESEASTSQTLQTASQLAELSRDLLRLTHASAQLAK